MFNIRTFFGSIFYTLITLGASFLPLFGAIALSHIYGNESVNFTSFLTNGEVNIICITLCIAVIFSLYQYKTAFGLRSFTDVIFILTILVCLFFAIVYAYGISKISGQQDVSGQPFQRNYPNLAPYSIIMLIWTILCSFISKYKEDSTNESVRQSRNEDQNNLEARYNNIRD